MTELTNTLMSSRFQSNESLEWTSTLKDRDWRVRARTASALGESDVFTSEVMSVLLELLRDIEFNVRYSAQKSFIRIGKPAIPYLLEASKDEKWGVRALGANALGKITVFTPEIAITLLRALKDEEWGVCLSAQEALIKIGKPAVPYLVYGFIKQRIEYLSASLVDLRNQGILFAPAFDRAMYFYTKERRFLERDINRFYFEYRQKDSLDDPLDREFVKEVLRKAKASKDWLAINYSQLQEALKTFLSTLKPEIDEEENYWLISAEGERYFSLQKPARDDQPKRLYRDGIVHYGKFFFQPTSEGKEWLRQTLNLSGMEDKYLNAILTRIMWAELGEDLQRTILLKIEDVFPVSIKGHLSTLAEVFKAGLENQLSAADKKAALEEIERIKNGEIGRFDVQSEGFVFLDYKNHRFLYKVRHPFDILLMLLTEKNLNIDQTMKTVSRILDGKLQMTIDGNPISPEDILTDKITFRGDETETVAIKEEVEVISDKKLLFGIN